MRAFLAASRTERFIWPYRSCLVAVVVLLFSGANVSAQSSTARISADRYFREGNYAKAAEKYEEAIKANPNDGHSWNRLGYCSLLLKSYSRAIESFNRAIALKNNPAINHYNLACAFARSGRNDEAMVSLRRSVDAGFRDTLNMQSDPDLGSIRSRPEFQKILVLASQPLVDEDYFKSLQSLRGLWHSGEETLNWSSDSRMLSQRLELVSSSERSLHVRFCFNGQGRVWQVAGADSDGTVFWGIASFRPSNIEFIGKRNGAMRKVTVSVKEGDFVSIVVSESIDGKSWRLIRTSGFKPKP